MNPYNFVIGIKKIFFNKSWEKICVHNAMFILSKIKVTYMFY